ncbi:MAG: sortase B protein-sorting domain-containing protein, partial [Clostridia bacterium]|nr:sortase B protein-sorting domain-containing protein [Clostridia bacterium]
DNEHIIDGTQIVLTASKTVDGREPAEGEVFTFTLEGEDFAQTKQNAGGTVTFDPILYTEEDVGEHVYTITEQAQAGYMTDPSVYTVTVTVIVGEDYALNAQITSIKRNGAEADTVLFENTIPETEIRLTARKTVNGDAPAAGEVFTFRLTGEGVDMTASNVGGEIVFDPIGYTGRDAGRRFTYTIREEAAEGYITDETVYTVTVAVEQNADGSLAARVEQIRCDAGNAETMLFRNEREKEDVVPKTGDESMLMLYALLCLGAAAGFVLMSRRRTA